ncbi:MAG: bifunctional GNAT family N-acetyltransferase/class I SAM-dependent methyltransferase [Eubacterium sp.]|uniref:bifunctional GNAT family N-acetyltransferase/class I SAM-dependent methyltransferase n=1 Tax=Eubacterium sp. TaxID=142586 RepID=UPI00300F0154
MYDTVAYIYKDYRIEFKEEGYHVYGEAFYPGEVLPVGTITGHSYNSKDENDISHMKDNSLHIDMLIVSEKHNGKGVGSTLMKMMMLYVEKRKFKHVTTNPTPIDGRTTKQLEKFYHKFHFSTGIMIKRIEFVDDKDMFELDSDENSEEEFETQKIKNINHDVEKAVSSQKSGSYQEEEVIEGLQPVEKIELKENIQAALRVLDEEAHKIEMKKVMLEEISNANGIEESLYELEQDVELKQEATNKRTASDNVKISLKQDDNKKKQKLKTECKISDKLEDDFTKEGKDDYAEHLKEKTGSEEKAASQVNHIPNSYNIGILTTIYYVEERLPKKSDILDISSRFVAKKAYFEQKGHKVTSVNSIDLTEFNDESFDVVLAVEPMDKLKTKEEQVSFLKEAYRVCKVGGRVFVSFTSNDMMLANEILNYDPDFLKSENVDKKTMKILHGSKTTFTIDEMEDVIHSSGMEFTNRFAMDGIGSMMTEQIDAMNDSQFNKWMSYHLYTCEKEHGIGYSSSIVYIIKKIDLSV